MLVLGLAGLLGFTFMRGVDHLREPRPYSYTAPNREFTLELPAKPDGSPQAVDNPSFPDGLTATMVLVGDDNGGIGVLQCIVDPSLRFDAAAAMRGSVL